MSSTALTIIAAIAIAVVLDWWLIRWLTQRRAHRAASGEQLSAQPIASANQHLQSAGSTAAVPPARSGQPVEAAVLVSFRNRPAWTTLAALAIAAVAQIALVHNQTFVAGIGYLLATLLFVAAMRPFIPDTFVESPPPAEDTPEPSTHPPGATAPRAPTFFQNWRYYTISDLVMGRPPKILAPPESAPTSAAEPTQPSVPEVAAASPPPTPDALITTWTGELHPLAEPRAVVVTQQGQVLVVDSGHGAVYCFDSQGNLLKRWSVPGLPTATALSVAVSPDGGTLYVADAENRSVKVITLSGRGAIS